MAPGIQTEGSQAWWPILATWGCFEMALTFFLFPCAQSSSPRGLCITTSADARGCLAHGVRLLSEASAYFCCRRFHVQCSSKGVSVASSSWCKKAAWRTRNRCGNGRGIMSFAVGRRFAYINDLMAADHVRCRHRNDGDTVAIHRDLPVLLGRELFLLRRRGANVVSPGAKPPKYDITVVQCLWAGENSNDTPNSSISETYVSPGGLRTNQTHSTPPGGK